MTKVYFASPDPAATLALFQRMGFAADSQNSAIPFFAAGQVLQIHHSGHARGPDGLGGKGIRIGLGESGWSFDAMPGVGEMDPLVHENGALSVARIIAVANAPQEAAQGVATHTGADYSLLDDGADIDLEGLCLRIIGPERARRVFAGFQHDAARNVAFVGLTFAVTDMRQVELWLSRSGLPSLKTPNGHSYLAPAVAHGSYLTFMAAGPH